MLVLVELRDGFVRAGLGSSYSLIFFENRYRRDDFAGAGFEDAGVGFEDADTGLAGAVLRGAIASSNALMGRRDAVVGAGFADVDVRCVTSIPTGTEQSER